MDILRISEGAFKYGVRMSTRPVVALLTWWFVCCASAGSGRRIPCATNGWLLSNVMSGAKNGNALSDTRCLGYAFAFQRWWYDCFTWTTFECVRRKQYLGHGASRRVPLSKRNR